MADEEVTQKPAAKAKPRNPQGNRSGRRNGKKMAQERINVVDQMLRSCYTHQAIISVITREWQIQQRQARNYIRKVYDRWEKEAKETFVDRVHLRRSQLEGVLEKAMQGGDLRIAVAALDRLCRIDGAYAPTEINATVTGLETRIARMTSDEQRKEIEELWAKYQKMPAAKGPRAERLAKANGAAIEVPRLKN